MEHREFCFGRLHARFNFSGKLPDEYSGQRCIYPASEFVVQRNPERFKLGVGIEDNNFLGCNITLELNGNIGTYGKNFNFGIEIPRKLLYKNMTLSSRL